MLTNNEVEQFWPKRRGGSEEECVAQSRISMFVRYATTLPTLSVTPHPTSYKVGQGDRLSLQSPVFRIGCGPGKAQLLKQETNDETGNQTLCPPGWLWTPHRSVGSKTAPASHEIKQGDHRTEVKLQGGTGSLGLVPAGAKNSVASIP